MDLRGSREKTTYEQETKTLLHSVKESTNVSKK